MCYRARYRIRPVLDPLEGRALMSAWQPGYDRCVGNDQCMASMALNSAHSGSSHETEASARGLGTVDEPKAFVIANTKSTENRFRFEGQYKSTERMQATLSDSARSVAPAFVPMFNGSNTAGWFNPFNYGRVRTRNGQILLSSDRTFFLVSDRTYSNFILSADILLPPGGRSGLEFRMKMTRTYVNGYKADAYIGANIGDGGLWSQSDGWLARPPRWVHAVSGHWNHYVVEAVGDHITILVNNHVTVNMDSRLFTQGYIALQCHGDPNGVYHFKNIEIENFAN